MTADLPDALQAVVERIETAPRPSPADPADGVLGRLGAWWTAMSPAGRTIPLRPVELEVSGRIEPLFGLKPQARLGVDEALLAGIAAVDRAVDSGATLLVVGPLADDATDDDAARAVIALLTRREASAVLPQPPGLTDRAWTTRVETVRDLAAGALTHRGEPVAVLTATGAVAVAAATGSLLAASARRTPCVLDGTTALAAAVVADRIAHRAYGWWLAASDSADPGRTAAIARVDLAVAVPLSLADSRGLGARAVLALLPLMVDDDARG